VIYREWTLPLCPVCKKSVPLETAMVDSAGHAIHAECYLRTLHETIPNLDFSSKPN
jgi:hypothetical protein